MKDCGEFVVLGDSGKLTLNLLATQGAYLDSQTLGWAQARLTAETMGFQAEFNDDILLWELSELRDGLNRLHRRDGLAGRGELSEPEGRDGQTGPYPLVR